MSLQQPQMISHMPTRLSSLHLRQHCPTAQVLQSMSCIAQPMHACAATEESTLRAAFVHVQGRQQQRLPQVPAASSGYIATFASSPHKRRQHQHAGEASAAHAKGGAADAAGADAGAAPPNSSFGQYLWAELNPKTATPPSVLRHGLAERQRV